MNYLFCYFSAAAALQLARFASPEDDEDTRFLEVCTFGDVEDLARRQIAKCAEIVVLFFFSLTH
jgi:hypothetical protein